MRIPLVLEDIGRGNRQELLEMAGPLKDVLGLGPLVKSQAWVAKISPGSKKEFLRPNVDYSKANNKATRGVYKYYWLEEGEVYEVSKPISWKRTERFFCRIEDGKVVKITKEEASRCQKYHSV